MCSGCCICIADIPNGCWCLHKSIIYSNSVRLYNLFYSEFCRFRFFWAALTATLSTVILHAPVSYQWFGRFSSLPFSFLCQFSFSVRNDAPHRYPIMRMTLEAVRNLFIKSSVSLFDSFLFFTWIRFFLLVARFWFPMITPRFLWGQCFFVAFCWIHLVLGAPIEFDSKNSR